MTFLHFKQVSYQISDDGNGSDGGVFLFRIIFHSNRLKYTITNSKFERHLDRIFPPPPSPSLWFPHTRSHDLSQCKCAIANSSKHNLCNSNLLPNNFWQTINKKCVFVDGFFLHHSSWFANVGMNDRRTCIKESMKWRDLSSESLMIAYSCFCCCCFLPPSQCCDEYCLICNRAPFWMHALRSVCAHSACSLLQTAKSDSLSSFLTCTEWALLWSSLRSPHLFYLIHRLISLIQYHY